MSFVVLVTEGLCPDVMLTACTVTRPSLEGLKHVVTAC